MIGSLGFLEAGLFFGRIHPFSSVHTWDISHSFFLTLVSGLFGFLYLYLSWVTWCWVLIYIPLLIALDEGLAPVLSNPVKCLRLWVWRT